MADDSYLLVDFSQGTDSKLMIILPYHEVRLPTILAVLDGLSHQGIPYVLILGNYEALCSNPLYCEKITSYRQSILYDVLYNGVLIPRDLANLISEFEQL